MNKFENFKQLHQQNLPLVLANIWDVESAKTFETLGYQAIGTSSQALAVANGYQDGEQMPFELLVSLTKNVMKTVNVPFTVDIEGGYARNLAEITANIQQLADLGISGINIEDTVMSHSREFQTVEAFSELLLGIANYLSRKGLEVFLNVRTDGFLLGKADALQETLLRIKNYEDAGANGIFVPCITEKTDIKTVVSSSNLPINVMCMPGLPSFNELTQLGVKRISFGPFLFNKAYQSIKQSAQQILETKNFGSLFS